MKTAVTLCLALLASVPALAAYPDPTMLASEVAGSVCVPLTGNASYTSFGAVRNTSTTQSLIVDCPVPYFANIGTTTPVTVWAHFIGNGAQARCTFFMEEQGPLQRFHSSAVTTTAVGYVQPSTTIQKWLMGYLHAVCTLPPVNGSSVAELRSFSAMQ